jgi:hypothetical protein
LHSKRVLVDLRSRIPISIRLVLFDLAFIGRASVGYQAVLYPIDTRARQASVQPL